MLSSCLETTWANICAVGIMDYNFSSWFLQTADVLSEEAILKWYNDAHTAKGKSVFLERMKKFVEWLKNPEEESESEEEETDLRLKLPSWFVFLHYHSTRCSRGIYCRSLSVFSCTNILMGLVVFKQLNSTSTCLYWVFLSIAFLPIQFKFISKNTDIIWPKCLPFLQFIQIFPDTLIAL